MKLYDITVPITNSMTVWPDDPPVRIERNKSMAQGDVCNLTSITMCVHSGTHIDAPLHFVDGGRSVDAVPLEILNGPCRVIETGAAPLIEKKHIEHSVPEGCMRVLFKTGNSDLWRNGIPSFRENFTALDADAADYLVTRGIVLVGIDYLSIETFRAEQGNPVHSALLRNNVVILEGCDLSSVPEGDYNLICLPLKIAGVEGAPVRALLREMPPSS